MENKEFDNLLSKISQQVIDKLHQRQHRLLKISLSELATVTEFHWIEYGQMWLIDSTDKFLYRVCLNDITDPSVAAFYQGLSFGVTITIIIDIHVLQQLPYHLISKLPVYFNDHDGKTLFFFIEPLLSYHKCCKLHCDYLVIAKKTVITPLAMETLRKNNISIIRLEKS